MSVALIVAAIVLAWLIRRWWKSIPVITCRNHYCGGCGGPCPHKISDSRE